MMDNAVRLRKKTVIPEVVKTLSNGTKIVMTYWEGAEIAEMPEMPENIQYLKAGKVFSFEAALRESAKQG